VKQAWTFLYISCRLGVGRKNTLSTYKRWRTSVWNEGGGSRLDSTSAYSEMPGELKENLKSIPKGIKSEAEYEKIRKYL
jgi:hypothetical protein